MSQIPIFWNYEKIRSRLLKPRGVKDRLKARVELELFGGKLDF